MPSEEARVRKIAQRREARVRQVAAQALRSLPRKAREARGNWLAKQQMRQMNADNDARGGARGRGEGRGRRRRRR